ncbi:hypothetical protein QJS10_CPB20g00835 [Acorus calamus]|uniref:Uncharacterized protein n=1 Tax=Acorus calamus TaxID=4465 RepID=A0AAV9CDM7_ACOCL|nr:hypothetical protein QJS10_CPB20g00835 [Acorus calamus]
MWLLLKEATGFDPQSPSLQGLWKAEESATFLLDEISTFEALRLTERTDGELPMFKRRLSGITTKVRSQLEMEKVK